MKKFYALALAATAAVSMNAATLYLRGDGTNLSWDADYAVESAADGSFVIDFESLGAVKISTTGGTDWNEFNVGNMYGNIDLLSDAMTQTVAFELNANAGNITMPWRADWKLTIPADLSTITITTTTPKPTEALDVYLRGDAPIGWDVTDDWKFDTPNGKIYFFDVKGKGLLAGQNFKVAGSDWQGLANYGLPKAEGPGGELVNQEVYPGEELVVNYNAENMTLALDYEDGTIVFYLPDMPHENTIIKLLEETIEHTEAAGIKAIEAELEEAAAAEYYNLQGVRVMEPAAGLYLVRKAGKVEKVIVK